MIDFRKIDLDKLLKIKPILDKNNSKCCDFTLGVRYMRKDFFNSEISFNDDDLIFKDYYEDDSFCFSLPIGKDLDKNIDELIKYFLNLKTNVPFAFHCLNEEEVDYLKNKFQHFSLYQDEAWDDYLYLNESFKTFKGKKLQAKRHFANNFLKLYPNVILKLASIEQKENIKNFIKEFAKNKVFETEEALYEINSSLNLVDKFDELGLFAFILEDDNKIIGVSIIEKLGDTIFDHVEKCNKDYKGIYPFFVQKIANYFQDALYFNREDDANDLGLRFSKRSYYPLKMVKKIVFEINNNLDFLKKIPYLEIDEDYFLEELKKEESEFYKNLSIDETINKYWGYDYKEDLKGIIPDQNYFYEMVQNDFKNKECFVFIIKNHEKECLGEVCLHHLTLTNEVELGIRIIPKFQKLGLAKKSLETVINFLNTKLNIQKLKMECYKENIPSIKLITSLGFKKYKEDDNKYYYLLDLSVIFLVTVKAIAPGPI